MRLHGYLMLLDRLEMDERYMYIQRWKRIGEFAPCNRSFQGPCKDCVDLNEVGTTMPSLSFKISLCSLCIVPFHAEH